LGDCRVLTLDMMRMKKTYFEKQKTPTSFILKKAV
jgi:hypothetical protein